MSKSKRNLMIAVAGAMLLAAGAARAGRRASYGGIIRMGQFSDGTYGASGVVSMVRASADSYGDLYCYTYGTWGACGAQSNDGHSAVGCTTTDPGMLAVMRSLNGDSYLSFQTDTLQANCLSVAVQNDSMYQPKAM